MSITKDKLIIHFTQSLSNLESIISSLSLRLRYSKEDFLVGNQKVSQAAHPMVCFSQYGITELKFKKISYGKYAIAFSTDWARRKKMSPVIYINKSSMAAKGLGTLLRARRNQSNTSLPPNLKLAIIQMKCFTKNEQGYNSHLAQSNFNFKDENEWRFVPNKKDIGNGLISKSKSAYSKRPDYYNKRLKPYPLKFRRTDIKYIYVSNFEESIVLKNKYPILSNIIKIADWQ